MNSLVHDFTGLIHLISSLAAVVLGTLVLVIKKGTRLHKRIGYAYAACMLIVIATAFSLYHLFRTFGPFHVAAVISFCTLLTGMVPAIRRSSPNWLQQHMSWMYYSVIGLYAAFLSEVIVRIPGLPFAFMVILATVITFAVAMFIFARNYKTWLARYSKKQLPEIQKHLLN